MAFFKNLFGKKKTPEEQAREFWATYQFGSKAFQVDAVPDIPVSPDVMKRVLLDLTRDGVVIGHFVGKKGWFIPQDDSYIENQFKIAKKHPVKIEDVATELGLNNSRSVLALKGYAKRLQKQKLVVFQSKEYMLSIDYLKDIWRTKLSEKDLIEEEIFYDDILETLPHSEVFVELLPEWLQEDNSFVVKTASGRIVLRDLVPELVADEVKSRWENGATQLTFQDLSEKYGLSTDQISAIVRKLVSENEIDDVTIYVEDELIKRRSSI